MKKLIGIILILALLLTVLGCDVVSVPSDPTTTESVPEETYPSFDYPPVEYIVEHVVPETGLNAQIQYLPETVENPDNLPVLKWVCVAPGKQTWTEDAVHELNRMLKDRNMPYRVQFVMLTGDADLYADWLDQPETKKLLKDADLIWAWMTPEDQQEYLMPITEYVTGDAQPSLKNAVVHELNWLGGTVDGEIYGIQASLLGACCHAWSLKPEVLTKYGLTTADFNRNFWEMDDLFAKIYKANGNEPFLYAKNGVYGKTLSTQGVVATLPGTLSDAISNNQQNVGLTFGIDVSSGVPTVVNILETDTTRQIHEAMIRYKDAGYTTVDEKKMQIFYQGSYGNEIHSAFDRIYIPVTEAVFDYNYDCYTVSGVASVSQHKDAAVSLLNLIAEDETFRHHLLFGKEGRDYVMKDGYYSEIKQDDGAYYNMEFLSMYSYFDRVREKDVYPISYDGMTKLETYLECMDDVAFCYYPVIFNYTGLEAELEEYARIYGDYCHYFTNTEVDVNNDEDELPYKKVMKTIDGVKHEKHVPRMDRAAYDEMLQKLNEAGAQKIIAELQRQLDEWLADNPDWQ